MVRQISISLRKFHEEPEKKIFTLEIAEDELVFIKDCIRSIEIEYSLDSSKEYDTWRELKEILEKNK